MRVPLWVTLALCAGSVALGSVWAQGGAPKKPAADEPPALTEYPYLPPRYGEPYIPSVADWQALKLTALGAGETRLTDQFSRRNLTCFADKKGLLLTLDLIPQPGWKYYSGGKFIGPAEKAKPDIVKAIDASQALVHAFFSEVADKDVSIQLFLNSESIGTWHDGVLSLNLEKPAAKKE